MLEPIPFAGYMEIDEMSNKPVAYLHKDGSLIRVDPRVEVIDPDFTPLYTQDQLEEARKLGMQQERALWNLSESTQEIMNTHPVKELTDEEIDFIFFDLPSGHSIQEFARAILRKVSEK